MRYNQVVPGRFLARPNRFIAHVDLGGGPQVCHVPNTGRCRELLLPGAAVWLERAENPRRKTAFSLIAVEKQLAGGQTRLINLDSQAPNRAFEAAASRLFPGLRGLRREVTFGDSRFDFALELEDGLTFVEVKGVTLEEDGLARFPDAPTLRGVKHLEGLIAARAQGHGARVCFVIQMAGVAGFAPNDGTHPAFGAALRRAREAGVGIMALSCRVTPDSMTIDRPVPLAF